VDARPADPVQMTPAGLCETCRHARRIVSDRGSTFVLCELSRTDARFVRYPRLPVVACTGFAPVGDAPSTDGLDAPRRDF
jgi:hypothetical protein